MKATLLLVPMALGSLAAWAQTPGVTVPEAGGQTPPTLGAPAEAWTKAMTDAILDAVAKRDRAAIAQIILDYAKRVAMGMNACGHAIDEGTVFDTAASNASQELAIVVRWLDPKSTSMHSAVFTGHQRCVAMDGATVDGKSIVRVLPNSLGISGKHAMVAFEAEYRNSPAEAKPGVVPHRGIFIEHLFLAELDKSRRRLQESANLKKKIGIFSGRTNPGRLRRNRGLLSTPRLHNPPRLRQT